MQILTDYPWYFVPLCVVAGVLYGVALYGLGRRRQDAVEGWPRWVRVLLPVLRCTVVTLLALLLLGPLVKRRVQERERPVVVVAEDVSESVTAHGYALADEQWEPVLHALERDYDVVRHGYGARLLPAGRPADGTDAKVTDMSQAMADIQERYAGRNVAAVVLTGDGLYNQGQNPTALARQLAVPLYTVALGDTVARRDAAIASVRYNRVVYMGNSFPVEVTVRASGLGGRRSRVSAQPAKAAASDVTYDGDRYTSTVTLTLEAERPGLQTYTIALVPVDGEATADNNRRTIAVEVIDGRQKIALVAAAPHPDIAALRGAIEHNPNYALDVYLPNQLAGMSAAQFKDYNLLVLHNLPSAAQPQVSTLVQQLAAQLPTVYVVGTGTDLGRFNAMHSGLEVVARTRKTDEVTARMNGSFSLFTLDENLGRRLSQMPPLQAPFGAYRMAANVQMLFEAAVGGVGTGRPLIAFGQQEGLRRGYVAGEGLWRWRLQSYQMTGSHDDFNTLVEKMVVYTSLQVGKERFRVSSQSVYGAGEPVLLEAELYNDNYEPVNTPEAELTIVRDNDRQTYTFNRGGTGYVLRLGTLEAGSYHYEATTTWGGKSYKAQGGFVVEEVNLEATSLTADHALMNTLAATTGGRMLTADSLDLLPGLLAARDDVHSVIYSHTAYTDLLHVWWVLALLVLLLAVEWGVRKYYL